MTASRGLPLLSLLLAASLVRPAGATAQEPADLPCDPCELAKAWPNLPPDAREEITPRLLSLLAARSHAEGDRRAEAAFLALEGLVALNRDDVAGGHRLLAGSLGQLVGLGDTYGAGTVALMLGLDHAARGEWAEGEGWLRRAIDLFAVTREPVVLDAEGADAIFLALLDIPPRAAGLSWRTSSDRPGSAARAGEALAHAILAEILAAQDRLGAAEAEYTRAIKLGQGLGSGLDHPARIGLAEVFAAQGRSADARRVFAEALAILDAVPVYGSGEQTVEVRMRLLRTLADLDRGAGRLREALEHSQAALDLARGASDGFAEVLALWELAESHRAAGNEGTAARAIDEIASLAPSIPVPEERAKAMLLLAAQAHRDGEYEEALRRGGDAAALLGRADDREAAGMVQLFLAGAFSMFHARDRSNAAIERAAQAVAGDSLRDWGRALQAINQLEERGWEALPQAIEALKQVELRTPDADWNEALRFLEAVAERWTDDPSAEEVLTVQEGRVEESVWSHLRAAAELGGDQPLERARESSLEWLASARRQKDLRAEIMALRFLALLDMRLLRNEVAIEWLCEAVEVVEKLADRTRLDDLVVSFLGEQETVYRWLVMLLARSGRTEEAFSYVERARARVLLRLLGNQRLNPDRGAEPGLLAEAEAMRTRILALEADARVAQDEASASTTRRDADAVRKDLEDLLLRIKLSNPQYAALTRVEPVNLGAVQELLAPEVTLVSFFVTDRQSYAWVVTVDRYQLLTLEVPRERLVELVEQFREEIAAREMQRPPGWDRGVRVLGPEPAATRGSAGDELARVLLAPLAPYLRTPRLLFVPHDSLHYLPFAALRNPETGRYLVEDFTLSHAPSASVLALLERRAGPMEGRALVLGDPTSSAAEGLPSLSGARREATVVARLLDTQPHLDTCATETLLRDRARGVDLLHVAAHSVLSADDPRLGFLALAPDDRHDGKLEMREIFEELDLEEVDLVVLSACETALGRRTGGDEIVGLTRALLYAGAASVMASLWSVDDEASAALMTAFYRRLLAGEPAADALAAAQRELLAAEETAAPFYWAAFTLVGEPWEGGGSGPR